MSYAIHKAVAAPRLALAISVLVMVCSSVWGQPGDDDFQLARNLFRDAEDYATTAELFAEFIRNYPDSPQQAEARLMLARSYARSGRCGDAVGAYEAFYQRHPDHLSTAEARRERAACLRDEGEYLRAAQAFEEIRERFSAGDFAPRALLDAAANYGRANDVPSAERMYATLIEEYPSDPLALTGQYRLALLLFAHGRPTEAQSLLEQIAAQAPASPAARDALLLSGRIFLVLSRRQSASQIFGQLERDFPRSAHADSALIDMASHLFSAGQYEDAVVAFSRAGERLADASLRRRAALGLADAQRYSGRFDRAQKAYETLLSEGGGESDLGDAIRLGLAICYGRADRFTAAVGLFHGLIQSGSPGSGAAAWTPAAAASLRELGSLYRRQGDFTRAITWLRRYGQAADRWGDDFPEQAFDRDRTQLLLAQVYDAAGSHAEAAEAFGRLTSGTAELAAEAQYGLALARENAGARDLAIREYATFLERFPIHRRAAAARDRVEYLTEFAVADAEGLDRALQQALIDELSGRPRQGVLQRLAAALRAHQDYANAVQALETYVASYPDDPGSAQAQYHLGGCLHKLARQRRLEDRDSAADSLLALALQEDRILAAAEGGEWSARARLRLVEAQAQAVPDSSRLSVLETGYRAFLAERARGPDEAAMADVDHRALLGLADALRQRGETDTTRLDEAAATYRRVLVAAGTRALSPRARFGLGLCLLQQEKTDAAIDSLRSLLQQAPDTDLQPDVLFVLGQALQQRGELGRAVGRFEELLLTYPSFHQRRVVQEDLAGLYLQLGEYGPAVDQYAELLSSDPFGDPTGMLRWRLARSHRGRGQPQIALGVYTRLLEDLPAAAAGDSMHLARARLLAEIGRPREAVEALARLARSFPDSPLLPAAARQRAALLFDLGQYAEAHAVYAFRLPEIEDGDALARSAVCLYQMDRLKEAEAARRKVRERLGGKSPWLPLFRLQEGEYHLRQHRYDDALKIFREVAQGGPYPSSDPPLAQDWSDAHLRELAADPAGGAAHLAATALWARNRASPSEEGAVRALEAQSTFLQDHPESAFAPAVHLRLGKYHFGLGNYLPAAGAFRRALQGTATVEQGQEAIWLLLQSYSRAFEYEQAYRIAHRLLRDYPHHPRANAVQLEIGHILMQRGKHADAVVFLEEVLEWASGDDAAEARYYIGQAYQQMGQYRTAIERYYRVSYHGADANARWITTADFQRAQCHEQLTEYTSASSIYERIIQREGSASEFGKMARERLRLLPSPNSD